MSQGAFSRTGAENLKIGNKVKCLKDYSFEACSFKQLSIPNNVTEIQYAVFRGCGNLEKIDFPDSLEKVGGDSFRYTKWYDNQKDGLIYAGNVLYSYKGNMPANTSIELKEGTKGISSYAFINKRNLVNITIPSSVTNIGDLTFYDCSMKEITIPNSVNEIGEYALGYKEADNNNGELVYCKYNTYIKCEKIPGFIIYGDAGSAAEKYATDYGIEFKENEYTIQSRNDGKYYCVNGKIDTGANGVLNTSQGWYYIQKGKVQTGHETVQWNSNGWWYIGTDGKVDFNKNTVAPNSNGWWVIRNGKVDFNYNGIASNANGDWYCQNGQVNFNAKGVLNTSQGWYYIQSGKVQKGQETVQNNSNGWWYIGTDGKVDFNKNTVAPNSNGWWVIRNGKVDFGYKRIASNANGRWYCNGGNVDFGYSGKYKDSTGKTYNIVNGQVK